MFKLYVYSSNRAKANKGKERIESTYSVCKSRSFLNRTKGLDGSKCNGYVFSSQCEHVFEHNMHAHKREDIRYFQWKRSVSLLNVEPLHLCARCECVVEEKCQYVV